MVGRQTVGIFSRSGEGEYRWLLDVLREEWTVSPFIITNSNYGAFCDQTYRCSFAILYHSRNRGRVNITDVTDSLYDDEVRSMAEVPGRERLIVVIDDLDDSSEEAKDRILTHQYSLKNWAQEIFLVTTQEKTNPQLFRRKMENIKSVIANSFSESPREDDVDPDIRPPEDDVDPDIRPPEESISLDQQTVGIFSRSGEGEYRWLLDGLREDWTVSPFIITNSNYGAFCDQIYRCSSGILYHSRNRGRVNITDVTDSLYDDEVTFMAKVLGRERLICVIDDLDDSSKEAKDRILTHQYSLKKWAQEIFLVTAQEKTNHQLLRYKLEHIKSVIANGLRPSPIEGTEGGRPRKIGQSRTLKGSVRKLVISALSMFALWNAYHFPNHGNGLLLFLWTAVTLRVLCIPASKPVLPLGSRACFLLSSIMTMISIYDTYHRPSAPNVTGSVLWMISCCRYVLPRPQSCRLIWRLIPYGPVLPTLWKMRWPSLVETTLQEICYLVARSPAILAAEGI